MSADVYDALAAELRTIADAVASLPRSNRAGWVRPYISVGVHINGDDEQARVAVVDTLGLALLGQRGHVVVAAAGVVFHTAAGLRTRVPGVPLGFSATTTVGAR